MAPFGVVKIPPRGYDTPSTGEIFRILVDLAHRSRSKIDGGARKDAVLVEFMHRVLLVQAVLVALVPLEHARVHGAKDFWPKV